MRRKRGRDAQMRPRRRLFLEALENRRLLVATDLASISGLVFDDFSGNGYDAGEEVSGASLALYRDNGDGSFQQGSDTLVTSATTAGDGRYVFQRLTAGGYFVFQSAQTVSGSTLPQMVSSLSTFSSDAVAGMIVTDIDTFNQTTQQITDTTNDGTPVTSSVAAPEVIGGERDLFVNLTSSTGSIQLSVNDTTLGLPGLLVFGSSGQGDGQRRVSWDGFDADASVIDDTGLGSVDLTSGSQALGLQLQVGADLAGSQAVVRLYSNDGNVATANRFSTATLAIPQTGGNVSQKEFLSFSNFAATSGGGADFSSVGAIELEITGTANIDGQADIVGTVGQTNIVQDFANFTQADLSLAMSVDDATPDINQNVNFTVTLTNNGPDTATNVAVSDQLPSGVNFVSSSGSQGSYSSATGIWTVGTVNSGSIATLQLTGRIQSAGTRVNFAEVSSSGQFDPNSTPGNGNQPNENDQASVTLVTALIDLSLVKTAVPTTVIVGNNVTYTVALSNAGPDTATGVVVKDELPGGVAFVNATAIQGTYSVQTGLWTVGTVAPGSTFNLTLVGTVEVAGPKTNTAEVFAADQVDVDSTPNNGVDSEDDQDSVTIEAPEADLSLTKSVDNDMPNLGDNVTFTLQLANAGPDTGTGVRVRDLLPAGLAFVSSSNSSGSYNSSTGIWDVGTLSAGGNLSLTIVATPTTADPLTNTAEVIASNQYDPDSTPDNNVPSEDDQSSVVIGAQQIDLSLIKTVDDATPNINDTITFSIVVDNDGPSDATGVEVQDILPLGLSFVSSIVSTGTYSSATGQWLLGNVANQGSQTLQIEARVNQIGVVVNTAQVMAADQIDNDSTPGNGVESEDDQSSVTVTPQQADLELTKVVDDANANVGQEAVFTITVSNQGPNPATNVGVTDQLPSGISYVSSTPSQGSYDSSTGVWTVGSISSGGQSTLKLVGRVETPGLKTNMAQVSASDQFDPDSIPNNGVESEDDQQSVSIIPPVIDLDLEKTIDIAKPNVGQTIRYTLVVNNTGPDDATNVVIADELPTGLNFVGSSASSGSYNVNTGQWSVGSLANGASATLNIDAVVDTVDTTTNISQVASVDQYDSESTPGNSNPNEDDYASVTFVLAKADLSVTKTVDDDKPYVGDNVTFTITVNNAGVDPATGVTLLDGLPDGLAYVSSNAGIGSYNSGTGIWDIGDLAVGQTGTLAISATSTNDTPLSNVVQVQTVDQLDPNSTPGNGEPGEDDQASVNVVGQQIDLSLTKTVNDEKPNVGDVVQFSIELTNSRATEATDVSVKDALPPGLTFQNSTANRGSYNGSTGVWTVGNVANGEILGLTISARVDQIGTVVNTAEVLTADQPDINSTPNNGDPSENDQGSVSVTPQVADLQLAKTVDDAQPDVGQVVVFTLVVSNQGPDAATGVSISDQLPDGLVYVVHQASRGSFDSQTGLWNVGHIESQETVTLELGAQVQSIGIKVNSAEIAASDQADPNSTPGNNVPGEDDQDSVSIQPTIIDLSLDKTSSPFRPSVNGEFNYTVTLYNAGPDTATGILVEDQFPSGVTVMSSDPSVGAYANGSWSVPSLAPQGQATLLVVTNVDLPGEWTNRVQVMSADQYDFDSTPGNDDGIDGNGNDEDDQASVTNTTASADLSITKSVSDDEPGALANVTYTVVLNNGGPDVAEVVVLDQIPNGLTFVSADATSGTYNSSNGLWNVPAISEDSKETLEIVVQVTSLGEKINTAEIIASSQFDPDSTPGNNDPTEDDQDSVSLVPQLVDLALTKMVNDDTPNVGDIVEFTLELTNQGPSTATGVVVQDQLPDGLVAYEVIPSQGVYNPVLGLWQVGEIPVGSRPRLEIDARVTTAEPLVNQAEIFRCHQPDLDSTPNNGVETEDDYSEVALTPQIADLDLLMDVNDVTPNQNEELFYTLIVFNRGPSDASNVMVRSILPDGLNFIRAVEGTGDYDEVSGLWTIPAIGGESAASMQLVVTVESKVPIISMAEIIASDQYDPNSTPDNQIITEDDMRSLIVTPKLIDISVAASADNDMPSLGDVVAMTFTVSNDGPEMATGVTIKVDVPSGLELVSFIPQRGTYSLPGYDDLWLVGNVAAGETVSLVLKAQTLQRGTNVIDMQVMSYDQADVDSDPGNYVQEEDDQTQLLVTVPMFSKRMFVSSTTSSGQTQSPFSRRMFLTGS